MTRILRYAGFKNESVYGTRVEGAATVHVDIASASLDSPSDVNLIYGGGLGKSARTYRPGYYHPEGNVVYAFDIGTIAMALRWALKGYNFTSEGGAGDLNLHEIWASEDITLPSFSVDLGKDAFEHRFMGCVLDTLTISVNNEFCEATLGIMAQKDAKAALITDYDNLNLPTQYPLAFHEVGVKRIGTGGGGADENISCKVKDFSLSIANGVNVDSGKGLGSRYPCRMPAFERTVTFDMNLIFEDTEELERFWGGSTGPTNTGTTSLPIEFDFDAGTDGSMKMLLPKVLYTGVNLQPSGRDEMNQQITGRAFMAPVTGSHEDCSETEVHCLIENNRGSLV